MNIITLKDPKIMGDKHPTYGYTFWSETDGDYPVMFNSKDGNILPDTRVTFEDTELKTSARGTEYLRLKKVKFEDSPQTAVPFETKQAPTFEKAISEQNTKDHQITKNMVWKNMLSVYDIPSMIPDSPQWNEFWGNVELHTEMLTVGNYDRLRGSADITNQKLSAPPTIKEERADPPTPATGYDKLKQIAKEVKAKAEFSDEDVPEWSEDDLQ